MIHDSPDGFDPPFRFDDETGEIRANGKTVWLTEREAQVFVTLLQNPGQVVDHGSLLEAIWGTQDVEDHHAIQVYVSRIRSKARELDGDGSWIRSIRRRGYVFHQQDATLVRLTYDPELVVTDIDPEKDVHINVKDGMLTIEGKREEHEESDQRSEFFYGRFMRTLSLPSGTKGTDIKASYRDGILEIAIPVQESSERSESIPISHG